MAVVHDDHVARRIEVGATIGRGIQLKKRSIKALYRAPSFEY
jgi:hypothetical protein